MIYGPYVSLANATENRKTPWIDLKPPHLNTMYGFFPSATNSEIRAGWIRMEDPSFFVEDEDGLATETKYAGYTVTFDSRNIRWSSPGGTYAWDAPTANIGTSVTPVYVRTGAGTAELGIGAGLYVLYSSLIPSGIVTFSAANYNGTMGELGIIRATGNWEAPFSYTQIAYKTGAMSKPCTYGTHVYFIDMAGELARTNGGPPERIGGAYNFFEAGGVSNPIGAQANMSYNDVLDMFAVNGRGILQDGRYGKLYSATPTLVLPPLYPADGNDRVSIKGILLYVVCSKAGVTVTASTKSGVITGFTGEDPTEISGPKVAIPDQTVTGETYMRKISEVYLPVNASSRLPEVTLTFGGNASAETGTLGIFGYKAVFDGSGKSGLGT